MFWYPDPDQCLLMRIRIRANDTDPTGSGSETLIYIYTVYNIQDHLRISQKCCTYSVPLVVEEGNRKRSDGWEGVGVKWKRKGVFIERESKVKG